MFNAPILQDEQKTREGPQNSTNAIVEDVYKMRPWLWHVSNTAHTSASTHRIMFIHMLSIMTKVLYWPMGRGPDQTSLLGHHWAQQNTWGRSTVKHIPLRMAINGERPKRDHADLRLTPSALLLCQPEKSGMVTPLPQIQPFFWG